jgi:hypothetical protein
MLIRCLKERTGNAPRINIRYRDLRWSSAAPAVSESRKWGRFVEVENEHGRSIDLGDWVHRPDGFWALRISPDDLAKMSSSHGEGSDPLGQPRSSAPVAARMPVTTRSRMSSRSNSGNAANLCRSSLEVGLLSSVSIFWVVATNRMPSAATS